MSVNDGDFTPIEEGIIKEGNTEEGVIQEEIIEKGIIEVIIDKGINEKVREGIIEEGIINEEIIKEGIIEKGIIEGIIEEQVIEEEIIEKEIIEEGITKKEILEDVIVEEGSPQPEHDNEEARLFLVEDLLRLEKRRRGRPAKPRLDSAERTLASVLGALPKPPEFSETSMLDDDIVDHEQYSETEKLTLAVEEVLEKRKSRFLNATREIQNLAFVAPGSEMARFLPDSTDLIHEGPRRPRRAARRIEEASNSATDLQYTHDAEGHFIIPQEIFNCETFDLCDCLDVNCEGCQWTCPTCKGLKCGPICRKNRKQYLAEVENCFTENPEQWDNEERFARNPFLEMDASGGQSSTQKR